MDVYDQIARDGYHIDLPSEEELVSTDKRIKFMLCHWNPQAESRLNKTLATFLGQLNRLELKDVVYTVLKENILNGIKANMKRIYFDRQELDIHNLDQYKKGIETFKDYMLENLKSFEEQVIIEKRYVLIEMWFDQENIYLLIQNNAPIAEEEENRIMERLMKADEIQDTAEVFMMGMDETEGAGLGLLLMGCLIKNEGIPLTNFDIKSDGDATNATLTIPLKLEDRTGYSVEIAEKILRHVEALPTFPSTITHIQNLIDSPDSTFDDIAQAVMMDVAISSNLLKVANSALYAQYTKVDSLERAIQLVGLKGLRDMLYSLGTKRIMEDRYPVFEEIWEKSNESAFIARKLVESKYADKHAVSLVTVGALLQNIGYVIMYSMEPETLKSIGKLVDIKQVPASLSLEESILGISHPKVAAMITQKWNFPEALSKLIEFHHVPLLIDDELKPVLFPIYMANMMIDFMDGHNVIPIIEPEAMEYFGYNQQTFQEHAQRLSTLYDEAKI
jgi:HD-like signal output (HDOD) protein